MIIKLVTTAQQIYTWTLVDGTGQMVAAPSTPNPADVATVREWALLTAQSSYSTADGVTGDNGCTLEIQVTQDDLDSVLDASYIALVSPQNGEPQIPALVATAMANIISAAYTP